MTSTVSIIICTYNRADSLQITLEGISRMIVPRNIDLEVLVVDNNSTDRTKEVIEKFNKDGFGYIGYIFERNQGLSFARNAGLDRAKGEIIIFTDDDVIVEPDWLIETVRTFYEYDADCVGGKILPVWPGEKPTWLSETIENILALLDYGDTVRELKAEDPPLFGANVAFTRQMLRKTGYFNTTLGRKGDKLYCSEDTDMYERLIKLNGKIIYQPKSVVHHVISINRLKKRYFRKWHFDGGVGQGNSLGRYEKRNILGIPYYIINEFLRHSFKYIISIATIKDDVIFSQEVKVLYYLGIIYSRIRFYFSNMLNSA